MNRTPVCRWIPLAWLIAVLPSLLPPGVDAATAKGADGNGAVAISGELKAWHKVTLTLDGPFACESDSDPNPFTDYRMTVTFRHESGSPSYEVPGYFAADGDAANTTANQNILAPGYPYFISAEWTLPYRHDRIVELLGEKQRHEPSSFESIQADVLSQPMLELLPILRQARPSSPAGRAALERIAQWDARMVADAPEPLIATAWVDRLRRLVFEDEVGEALFPLVERQRVRTRALAKALAGGAAARWCDDVRSKPIEACRELVDRALEDAVSDLQSRYGEDIAEWRWGSAHQAVSEHRPFSRQALLARFFEIRTPSPGDVQTINVGRNNPWDPDEPFANRWAASLRAIYDLSDLDNSRFIHSTGQSGHVLSPHYRDMADRWSRVDYLPMVTDRAMIEKDAYATLQVRPAR